MKKKIGDLTLREISTICDKSNCELTCIAYDNDADECMFQINDNPYLDEEIEVQE